MSRHHLADNTELIPSVDCAHNTHSCSCVIIKPMSICSAFLNTFSLGREFLSILSQAVAFLLLCLIAINYCGTSNGNRHQE
jgi:hypothetical protein